MTSLRVASFAISLDGYGAGPDQDLQNPLGVGGPELMEWFFHTRTWRAMHGQEGGETGTDDRIASESMTGFGAWILGRNMFGPVRGPWPDVTWNGWWGDEPPYHVPVFVLTHHARPPVSRASARPISRSAGAALRAQRVCSEHPGRWRPEAVEHPVKRRAADS